MWNAFYKIFLSGVMVALIVSVQAMQPVIFVQQRSARVIDEVVVIGSAAVFDGNDLGYDITFGPHGSFCLEEEGSLFFKNIRLENVRRGCVWSNTYSGKMTLLMQNVKIIRKKGYFFPEVLVQPGYLDINGVAYFVFKSPHIFTDRCLRNAIRESKQSECNGKDEIREP